MSGMTSMLGDKLKREGSPENLESAGSVHPQGALLALVGTVKKAAQQLARMEGDMAPFVNRAISILEQGVTEVVSKKGKAGASGGPPTGSPAESSPAAAGEGKGFPG